MLRQLLATYDEENVWRLIQNSSHVIKWIEDVSLCDIWYFTYSWVDKSKLKVKYIFNIVNQQTSHICEKRPSSQVEYN